MELVSITMSQVIQFFQPLPEDERQIDTWTWVRGLESRYRFWEAPHRLSEYDSGRGMVFQRGEFMDAIIDKLTVYENGALCQSNHSDTETLEAFIDDALQWSHEELGVDLARFKRGPRAYTSSIVVRVGDLQLGEKFKAFETFGKAVGAALRSYGQQAPDFQMSTIGFHGDYTKMPIPQGTTLIFERRAGQPYSSGLYFSTAPLRSNDHLAVLNVLEDTLSS